MIHRRNPRIVRCTAAVALALLLGGCGSGGGSEDGTGEDGTTATATPTTAGATSTTTTSTADGPSPEDERAASVTLEAADLPGWEVIPFADGADTYRPVDGCVPAFQIGADGQPGSFSTDYFVLGSLAEGDGAQLMADTVVFSDDAEATEVIGSFEDPAVVACLDSAIKARLADTTGLEVDGTLEAITPELTAEQVSQVSGALTLTADDGSTVDGSVSLMAFRRGDVGTVATTVAFGDSFDPEDADAAIAQLAALQADA